MMMLLHMCEHVCNHLTLLNYVIFVAEKVNEKRHRTAAEIVMAKTNLHEKAKKDVLDIAAVARA